ncbi:TerB family tellurite resistance protein [Endothiovibrio diazotrophicus]
MSHDYAKNSPEAMAAIVSMAMIVDAEIDDREIEVLDRYSVYALLDIAPSTFAEVFEGYLEDLAGEGPAEEPVTTVDRERIDHLLAAVDDPEKRILLCSILFKIIVADNQVHETEAVLFNHILEHWNLRFEDLESDVATMD